MFAAQKMARLPEKIVDADYVLKRNIPEAIYQQATQIRRINFGRIVFVLKKFLPLRPNFHSGMKRIYFIIVSIFMVLSLTAQTNESNLQRELTLEKEYTPELRDADKLNQVPEMTTPEAPKIRAEYSNYTLDCNIPPYFQAIKAKNYFTDFKTSGKRGYLQLGLGTLFNFDGDAGYQILNTPANQLNVFASRHSSSSAVQYLQNDEKATMKINDNLLGINFLHQFQQLKLTADAQYLYSGFNDYGLPVNNVIRIQDQVNQRFEIHTGIESVNNPDVTYKGNLSYTLFTQQYPVLDELLNGKENRILADAGIFSQWLGFAGSVKTYFYNLPATIEHKDYASLSAASYAYFEGDVWDAHLGVSFHLQTGEVKNFLITPDIRFNWQPVDVLKLYLSATGGFEDNSHYNIYLENRYINSFCRVEDTKIPVNALAGVSYSPLPNLGLNFFAGNEWRGNEHFYILSTTPAVYDNASVFKFGGNITYNYPDWVDIDWQFGIYNWNTDNIAAAWNKPSFVSKANIGFQPFTIPLRFDLNYHLEAGRKALQWENYQTVDMKNIHDLSLQAAYTLNSTVSFFAKANNLLFQKYDIWYGYPAQNFNFMAGAAIKF
jgi:hypothetical protein